MGGRRHRPTPVRSSEVARAGSSSRLVRGRIAELGEGWRYHVFLSYSQHRDLKTALRLRRALQSVGTPALRWGVRMRVFVDKRSLGANPALWEGITGRLDQSAALALLASPESRGSSWVRRELERWFDRHGADDGRAPTALPLLVLTGGELGWDPDADDFDWSTPESSQPLSRTLFEHRFPAQPLSGLPQMVDTRFREIVG
jgi:hypothetical protein